MKELAENGTHGGTETWPFITLLSLHLRFRHGRCSLLVYAVYISLFLDGAASGSSRGPSFGEHGSLFKSYLRRSNGLGPRSRNQHVQSSLMAEGKDSQSRSACN